MVVVSNISLVPRPLTCTFSFSVCKIDKLVWAGDKAKAVVLMCKAIIQSLFVHYRLNAKGINFELYISE